MKHKLQTEHNEIEKKNPYTKYISRQFFRPL